jgi:hypothetical protein
MTSLVSFLVSYLPLPQRDLLKYIELMVIPTNRLSSRQGDMLINRSISHQSIWAKQLSIGTNWLTVKVP